VKPAKIARNIYTPERWDELPLGAWLAVEIQHRLDEWCPFMFGYHLLKLGALSGELSCSSSTIRHQCTLALAGRGTGVITSLEDLPIKTGSIDACLLAHTLDFSADPHQVLRETERVLTEDGWIIISGFNPFSLVGLGKLMPHVRHRLPWSARMFSPERVSDWLHLLGFEIIYMDGFAYSALTRHSRIHDWRENVGHRCGSRLASIYMIAARKRTIPLTRLPQRIWRKRPVMVGGMARMHAKWQKHP
jgi:SAM-dependent methyltransferase